MTDHILKSRGYTHFTLLDAITGQENGSFQDAKSASQALPGDTVQLDESGIYLKSRGEHPPLAGTLITRTKTIYGMTSRNVPLFLFHPYDRSYPPMRVAVKAADRTKNFIAVARFEAWEKGDTFPRGSLVELLGHTDNQEAEAKAMQLTASPWWKPTYKAFQEEDHTRPNPTRLLIAEPTWRTINIDPEGCQDIDDTFSWRHGVIEDSYEIAIGIADVDAAIAAATPYDNIARKNAITIYTPQGEAVRPMLPRELSEDRLSLHVGSEAKPTLSLMFNFNMHTKEIANIRFQPTLTQNNKTYTYDDVLLDPYAPSRLMTTLTEAIQRLCPPLANGQAAAAQDPHNWIQALMVFYNLQAAAKLKAAGQGILRAHKAPDHEKLTSYMSVHPDLGIFAMEAAIYVHPTDPRTHYGFADQDYCHATSPIRRYADLFNQRALKALLVGEALQQPDGALLAHLNARQKAAKAYQRDTAFAQILRSAPRKVTATVVNITADRITLYVSVWKQIVKARTKPSYAFAAGTTVEVCYTYDTSQLHWKQRMIFALETIHP
jgi:exoribonuclease R